MLRTIRLKREKPANSGKATPVPHGIDGNPYKIEDSAGFIGIVPSGDDSPDTVYANLKPLGEDDRGTTFAEQSRIHTLLHVRYTAPMSEYINNREMPDSMPKVIYDAVEDCRLTYLVNDGLFPDYGRFVGKLSERLPWSSEVPEGARETLQAFSTGRFLDGKTCPIGNEFSREDIYALLRFMRKNARSPRSTVELCNYIWNRLQNKERKEVNNFDAKTEPMEMTPTLQKSLGAILDSKRVQDILDNIKPKFTYNERISLFDSINNIDFKKIQLPLELNHARRLGLRPRPTDFGVVPRFLNRYPWGPVFTSIQRFMGGTVLVDRSGSMQMSMEDMMRLMKNAPLSTIAEYDGTKSPSSGVLRIIARKGRSASERMIKKYKQDGENVIDYQCLKWLMKQEEPRVWVSDGNVTGYNCSRSLELKKACAILVVRGNIVRLDDVDDALAYFARLKGGARR